jgi:voltage-gated potassium channel
MRVVPWDGMLTESIIALILIGTSLIIHTSGIVGLGVLLVRQRGSIERRFGTVHNPLVLIGVFATLMLLHVAENCIWAAFYTWRGLFENYESSLYFSLSTYTTIGYGDVLLPEKWRLLGALEGISGVLLCGLSTAFLFAVVNALFQFRIQRMNQEKDLPDES